MSDEEAVRGFLPPRADGGAPASPAPGPAPGPAGPPPRNATAIAALALGVSGLACTLVFAGWLFFVAIPCSIMAWIFGVQGKRKVDQGEIATQRGMAQAGHVLGIVGVVLAILAIVFWVVLFFGLGWTVEEFEAELRR